MFSQDDGTPWAALELWKFDNDGTTLSTVETPPVTDEALHLATFHLPAIQDRAIVLMMELRSDPPPCWDPALAWSYVPAPTERVYVITLEVFSHLTDQDVDLRNALREISFFVRLPDILRVYTKANVTASGGSPTASPLVIRWNDWGHRNTRLFGSRPHTLSWVYGDKYVTIEGQRVVLYNFSPWSLEGLEGTPPSSPESERDVTSEFHGANFIPLPWQAGGPPDPSDARGASTSVHAKDTIVHCGNILTTDVHTGLAYRKTVAGWQVGAYSLQVMMDNEHILVLRRVRESSDFSSVAALTFPQPIGGSSTELVCLTF